MTFTAISFALCEDLDVAAVAQRILRLPGSIWLDRGFGCDGFFSFGLDSAVVSGEDWLTRARSWLQPGPPLIWRGRRLFAGGIAGWIGYEAGRHTERMPEPMGASPLGELRLRRYDGAIHRTGDPEQPWLIVGSEEFVARSRSLLAELPPAAPPPPASGRVVEREDPRRFLEGVRAILRHIEAGDCYQVNLARSLRVAGVSDPLAAFLRLRERSPAAYGALLVEEDGSVVSNSPELFLQLEGDQVLSRPIKGTRRLGRDEGEQAALVQELLDDPKERAELTMIVDLMRNDLGRVCRPGSVRAAPRQIQTLPTLNHAYQELQGQLLPGRDVFDLLGATFPPGSVTGAPKVQSMQVIRALESRPRGVYTGAIGFISDAGDAVFNVAIRTATLGGASRPPDEALLFFGSGIVADSDPERELEETEVKALALLRAFCA